MKNLVLSGLFLVSSTVVMAGGSKLVDTQEAVNEALAEFQKTQTHEVVDSFNGVKAWPTKGGVKAKIYLTGNGSISYSCHRHDSDEPFECHESN